MEPVKQDGKSSIQITVRKAKRDASYCGGGCNGCSCSHCKGGIINSSLPKEERGGC